ncbi:hypothetical protein [Sphingobacterium sp. SYP-B4668]|uniref:hypothetical protein n=1 Tax=Sphingobacterium sp. SYP-B4668 TaxID=2996035 RepID=UPI0022DDF05F|nr:hypothetical protein [Sphingobacterium sp. SYP-B4668]
MKDSMYIKYWVVILFMTLSLQLFGQSVVSFAPRTSQKAPAPYKGVSTYNIQGDFVMLGNTNLTLGSYRADRNNNSNSMVVVDKDNDNSTYNSSMSELKLGGGNSDCSEILYAGLYWTGRAENSGTNRDYITYNNKNYYKNKVKFKKEGNQYFEVDAGSQIAYQGSGNAYIYVGYADVTDYVRTNGVGKYWVADMALSEGSNQTGYFGGWGMVIVYKNSSMKWRDITVFDGYSYISANGNTQTLDISGFRAAQNGAVNVKMGLMAGEGDVGTTGDYIEMRERTSNDYTRLSHAANTTGNFFNSSIFTGNNDRNPNLTNNTGMDISMFDLPNSGNVLINNNQTSTRFRYGTSGDLYTIFSIVFAVDAYVPEVIGENKPSPGFGVAPTNGGTITPGQNFEFKLDVYNKGEEAVNNTKIEIPIPHNLHFISADITRGSNNSIRIPENTTVTWVPPAGAPSGATSATTPGGKLVWDIGILPKDDSKSILQGFLKYRFKVSDNCVLLTSASGPCGLEVKINGKISGTGATSGTAVSSDLVRDYGNGVCAGPVYDDFTSTISISADYIEGCNPPVENGMRQFKAFCELAGNAFARDEIVNQYPLGTKFFNQVPASYNSTTGLITGNFPVSTTSGEKLTYYAVVPGMDPGCYLKLQTSLEKVTTSPVTKNVEFCFGEEVVLDVNLSQEGQTNGYNLYYFNSDGTQQLSEAPKPTAVGTYSYKVAEGKNQGGQICFGPKVDFTVVISELPTVDTAVPNMSLCENNDKEVTINATGATSYIWEYSTSTAPNSWQTLSNSTFSNHISVTNNKLNISHAPKTINGLKVRLKVDNGKCPAISNEILIQVKDCRVITNPMLPSKARQ